MPKVAPIFGNLFCWFCARKFALFQDKIYCRVNAFFLSRVLFHLVMLATRLLKKNWLLLLNNMKRWIRGTILWRWWCRESFAQRLLFARKHLIMAGTDAPPRWDLGPPYIKAEDLLSWNLFPLLLFAELQCQTFWIVLSGWVGQLSKRKYRKTKREEDKRSIDQDDLLI